MIATQHKVWDELARYTDIPLEDLTLTKNAEAFVSDSQWAQLRQPTTAESSNSNHSSLRLILWSEAIRTVVYECIRAHKREIE